MTINEKDEEKIRLENSVTEEIENIQMIEQKPEFDTFGTALNEL